MDYKEEQRDLFTVPKDYALAHCISADFAMGAGIAVAFRDMGVKDEILNRHSSDDYLLFRKGFCIKTVKQKDYPVVYNLVTKQRSFHKPTYHNLSLALKSMRKQMSEAKIKKVAMPLIGCGLDGLSWEVVSELIKEVFYDTDVEILVCRR